MSSLHPWDVSPGEAVSIQQQLRKKIRIIPFDAGVRYIAGADISFNRDSDIFYAGFIVLDIENMQEVAYATATVRSTFPYIPGLLSFREIPALLEAWQQLPVQPNVVVLDGHGIAHPRRLGIASHFGLWVNRPTIGCAKKLLTGMHGSLAATPQAQSVIYDNQEAIGVALRTKHNVKPVYVSPGHLMDIDSAVRIVSRCVNKYRLPEPTRKAHLLVNQLRRGEICDGIYTY